MAAKKKAAKKTAAKKTPPPPAKGGKLSLAMAKALQAKFGSRSALVGDRFEDAEEYVSTGIDVLDWHVLGRGGLPIGRMSEWFGAENCGKTSMGYQVVAAVQRAGGLGVWAVGAGEGDIDRPRATTLGVNLSDLVILYPGTLEDFFEQAKFTLAQHKPAYGPMVMVWDSIASMVTKDGEEREAGSRRVGDVPLILSEELKKIVPRLSKHRAHLFATNQIRSKIGVMFGENITTPGGFAPKYYASQRVQFMGGKAVKDEHEDHKAKVVTCISVKNRLGPPWMKAKVRLDYATGWNNLWTTAFFAKQRKLIDAREAGFSGPSREGLEAYRDALEALKWKSRVPTPVEAEDEEIELDVEDDDDE